MSNAEPPDVTEHAGDTDHHTAAALVAVELAMRVINPETRAYAQRLHHEFLAATCRYP